MSSSSVDQVCFEHSKNDFDFFTEVIPSFPINVAIGIYHWLSKLIPKVILQFMARLTLLALVTYWFISRGHLGKKESYP